jgi:hypothetical protein
MVELQAVVRVGKGACAVPTVRIEGITVGTLTLCPPYALHTLRHRARADDRET